MNDHINQSIGGIKGYVFRRLIHISMMFVPVVYYAYGANKVVSLSVNLQELVSYIFLAILVIEIIRLSLGLS